MFVTLEEFKELPHKILPTKSKIEAQSSLVEVQLFSLFFDVIC